MMRSESTSALAQPRLTNPTLGGLVRDRARLRRGETAVVGMAAYITMPVAALQARSFAAGGRADKGPAAGTGAVMLQLRPNCEYCDKDLPPQATDARICTYECTFCADCVE